MYPARDARELAILLRISSELDVVGDVTATVENPSDLLAWGLVLSHPKVLAWRAKDSGHRYLQVSAHRKRAPIRGDITAVLDCERHADYWTALHLDELTPGDRRELGTDALSSAWATMPLSPEEAGQAAPPRPPESASD
jgi:hypothetical protein